MQDGTEPNDQQLPVAQNPQPSGFPAPSRPSFAPTPDEPTPVVGAPPDDNVAVDEIPEDDEDPSYGPVENGADVLQWTDVEYVASEKSKRWFLILAAVAVVLILAAIFILHSWTFAIVLAVMATAVGVLANRPPHDIAYQLSPSGVTIDQKHFSLHDFTAFGIMHDTDTRWSARLVPVKRFLPAVIVFFPEELGEPIVDILGSQLPMREMKPSIVDEVAARLHF